MEIPVDITGWPDKEPDLDESLIYEVQGREFRQAEDKNGNAYLTLSMSVVAPDEFKDRRIYDNYIPLPRALPKDAKPFEVKAEQGRTTKFMRIIKCFGLKFEARDGKTQLESPNGRTGKITIKNEEYPEGSGSVRPRPNNYLI